jgi:hypothetical protein
MSHGGAHDRGGRPAGLDRERAMAGRPCRLPVVTSERVGPKLHLTVDLERPRWQRFIGADARCRRTFSLDAHGQEVYGWCTGEATVAEMVDRFAGGHRVSPAEAELAVTRFLRTLMEKGLLGVGIQAEGAPADTMMEESA